VLSQIIAAVCTELLIRNVALTAEVHWNPFQAAIGWAAWGSDSSISVDGSRLRFCP